MRKIALLLIAISVNSLLLAQDSTTSKFSFNHLALSVKDVNRSAEFYSSIMQLPEITNRSKIEGIRWFALADGRELHLISVIKEPIVVNKALHIGLSTQNIDAFLQRLVALKIPYSNWPGEPNTVNIRADGVKQVYFQDPDGYWIEVNSVNDAAPVDKIKNEVWKMEENYWGYVKAKDIKSYITLWDENFIGYPGNNNISNKAHITDWLTELYKDKTSVYNYELTRKAVNVFDDIVIVLYDVIQTWTNDKGEVIKKTTSKITHTWKKTASGWLIIGGMGASK